MFQQLIPLDVRVPDGFAVTAQAYRDALDGADAWPERFDGFSIGSNDLTQLTLGVDRDRAIVADSFDRTSRTKACAAS